MATIRPIQTPGTARPLGHYSQAVVHGGLVFVSGQLPADLETGVVRLGSVEEQAELALSNLSRILDAAGSGLDRTLQVTIYLSSIEYWPVVNAVYARMLGDHRPARAVVPVSTLHYGTAVEIQAIAALRPPRRGRPPRPPTGPRSRGTRRRAAGGRAR
jgi:2-iminobutanoate/2-iminopropanoate deaminase